MPRSLRAQPGIPIAPAPPDGTVPPGTAAESALAPLAGATGWLNTPPLTPADLHGRVVLVDFCTYTCINWLRTLPHLRAWSTRYADDGLVVLGVHTPEFDFEQDVDNVRRAAADLRVEHPIALDPGYAVWDGFDNRYWPAVHLVDARGRIRHRHAGEGGEERIERVVRQLLAEAGVRGAGPPAIPLDGRGVEAAADWDSLASPENYLGYARTEGFASGRPARDTRRVHTPPPVVRRDHWGLSGDWTIGPQAVVLHEAGGRIVYRFRARDLHVVLAPVVRGVPVPFRIALDGRPPGPAHGADADERGDGLVTEPRLYQLLRQPGPVVDRTVEITFRTPGVRAYAFTFG